MVHDHHKDKQDAPTHQGKEQQEKMATSSLADVMAKRVAPTEPEEPENLESNTATRSSSHEDLQTQMMQLQKEVQELTEQKEHHLQQADAQQKKYIQALADCENVKRRLERDNEQTRKFAIEKFALELIPVMDTLERAAQISSEQLNLAAGGEQSDQPVVQSIYSGVEMTIKLFMDVLTKFGIKAVDPVGIPFDPMHHEAMSMVDDQNVPGGTVVTVIQKGYLLNERLVRPARVVVSRPQEARNSNADTGA